MEIRQAPERWLVAARLSRMSKRDRERGDDLITGIATQDQRSAEWARQEGHVIAHVTRDRGVSGSIAPWERPELGEWLTDPRKMAQYDGIVAWDAARVSRDYADLPQLRKWAERHGKKLFVIKDRLAWPDARDGMLWAVAAERAYSERQDTIERTTRELHALADAGKLSGKPAWGYTSIGEKYDRQMIPTDLGRKYIPEIYARCIAGDSLASIAAWLDSEGVAPAIGAKWWPKSVGEIIRNATYTGRRQDASGRTIHRCEPLIDAATFRRAGEALDRRPKRGPANAENRAMLAEVLACPLCKGPMYRVQCGGPRAAKTPYYRCAGRGSQRRGCGNMVRVGQVDQIVSDFIANFDGPIVDEVLVPGHDHAAELEELKMELRDLAARDLADDEYDSKLARLRAERDRLRAEPSVPDRIEYRDTGETYAGQWAGLAAPDRAAWLKANHVEVYAVNARLACLVESKQVPGTPSLTFGYPAALREANGVQVVVTWQGIYAAAELEE